MKILKSVQKIPGGLMVVPLFLGAIINTFFPSVLQIGSFTTALFSSAGIGATIGVALFCVGTQIDVKQAPEILKRGFVLLIAKFLSGFIPAIIVGKIFGPVGILGITPLAILASMSNSNAGLFLGLVGEYGDEKDSSSVGILAINDGPFLTMLGMGAGGMADIPLMAFVAAILPIIIGLILGNLDEDIRKFLSPGVALMIPFFSFPLGASLNLKTAFTAGAPGFLLGIATVIVSGAICILADRLILKRPGYAGAALASAAGNSVATPAAIAMADAAWEPYVADTTAVIAAAVIITAILVPILTSWTVRKWGTANGPKLKEQHM